MSNRHSDWDVACKIYVGGLSRDATKYDLEDAFAKYGSVRNIWVARQPPGFAFVEMEDSRDAEDAARGLDGTRLAGRRVKVHSLIQHKNQPAPIDILVFYLSAASTVDTIKNKLQTSTTHRSRNLPKTTNFSTQVC